MIYISIIFLLILLLYKIVIYVIKLKKYNNHSIIDIIFVIVILCVLFIPASHIDNRKKSKLEKRMLAKAPVFVKNHKLNLKYGNEFNAWFNDRFNFRNDLIQLNNIVKYNITKNYYYATKVTIYKKHNLFYSTSAFGLSNSNKNTDDVLKTYVKNVNELQQYCDKNNIKLYILVVPRKLDFFDYKIADKEYYIPDNAIKVMDYLKKNTKTKIIYPINEMKEANKETPVYFKTDHHWTKKGAYVGYLELMKEIKKDFPDVPILKESSLEKYYDKKVQAHWNKKFFNGSTFKKSTLPNKYAKKILDTKYLYYKNPNKDKLQTNVKIAPIPKKGKSKDQDNQFYYPYGLDKKVVVIGNSFVGNLIEFLPYSFKYTARYYDNNRHMHFETYEEVFNEYKPDIFVINVNTHYLFSLLNLYPNKYRHKEDI